MLCTQYVVTLLFLTQHNTGNNTIQICEYFIPQLREKVSNDFIHARAISQLCTAAPDHGVFD